MHRTIAALIACLVLIHQSSAQSTLSDSPLPLGAAAAAAVAAAAIDAGDTAAAVQDLKRNSLSRARAALSLAEPSWITTSAAAEVEALAAAAAPAAICGQNSLRSTANNVACRIIASWSDGTASTCSASKIANRHLATAGHCIYSPTRSQPWAIAIDVYCTGSNVCGVTRTTTATNMATTPNWTSGDGNPNAFDIAVIKVAGNLPGTAFIPAQLNVATSGFKAVLSGFPSQNPESRACNVAAFSNACRQYTSSGALDAQQYSVGEANMYRSGALDLCKGHSGSAVRAADTPRNIIGIVSGGTEGDSGACFNVFAPSMMQANANTNSCQGTSGGASLFCLAGKIP